MNTNQFKIKLEEEKALLEQELGRLGIKDPETGNWNPNFSENTEIESDPIDMGDRDEDFTEISSKLEELEIRYNDVLSALQKIENGSYGFCEVSGEEIEEDRLMANPAARTCKAHME